MTSGTDPYPAPRPRSRAAVAGAVAAIVMLVGGVVTAGALLAGGEDVPAAADSTRSTPTEPGSTGDPAETTSTSSSDTNAETETAQTTPPTTGLFDGYPTTYCLQMAQVQLEYTDFDLQDLTPAQLDQLVTDLTDLKAEAPEDVRADLRVFSRGITSMRDLFDDLGISFAQFQNPAFVREESSTWTAGQVMQVKQVAALLTKPEFLQAGNRLDDHFRSTCTLQGDD